MTNRVDYKLTRPRRGAYLLLAASLLFLLLYSAPHRVHHFFDQSQPTNQQDATDHHNQPDGQNKSPNNSDCIFQIAASRCAFGLTVNFPAPAITPLIQALVAFKRLDHEQQFLATAFPIRAPPLT